MSSPVAARAAYATLFGAIGASFPYLPVFYQANGLSLGQIGLLGSAAAATGLIGSPAWGALADRYPTSRLVLPAAAGLTSLAALALAFDGEPVMIAVAAIAMGLALSGISPILDARALDTIDGSGQAGYARLRVWGSVAFVIVVWVTGFLVERAGIASLFVFYVPLLAATGIVGLLLRGRPSTTPPLRRLEGIGLVLGQARLRRFFLAGMVVWPASMAINGFLSIHLVDIGAPGELVGASWAIGAAVEVPIMWAFPWLAARVGTRRLLIAGTVALALRAVTLPLLADPLPAALTMLLHGIGFGLVLVGGVTYVSRHAPPGTAATAQGLLTAVVFSVALILGPGLGGLAAGAWGLPVMFTLAAVASVAGIALMAVATRDPAIAAAPA